MPQMFAVALLATFMLHPITPAVRQAGYPEEQIPGITREIGKALEMPDDKVGDLIHNFRVASEQPWYREMIKGRPIVAVFVYRCTEAGLVYKRKSGYGQIRYQGGKTEQIRLTASSLGAQIGGGVEWGIGLVLDLKRPEDFGGTYAGTEKGATAIDATTPWAAVFSNEEYAERSKAHEVCTIATGRGLSAGVSNAKVTITPQR